MNTTTDRIHVLHVDDDPNLTELVADFLEGEDDRISVQTATSASAGLEALSDTDVDCVISDYDMPGQNGIEFLENVREERPNLPFILYTGKGSEEVASEAISSGVTNYLQKGSGTEQYTILANRILNAVESHISGKREDFLGSLATQITELSRDLLQSGPKPIETKIDGALETIGTLVEADRSYVFEINQDDETLSNTHEWTAESIEPQIDNLQNISFETLPWWIEKLKAHDPLIIPAVSDLPPEASAEKEILQEQDIKSLIVSPMKSEGELIGFVGFDWVEQQDVWSEDFIHILQISGEILSSAIQRESRRRELERREAYLEQSSDIISVMDSKGEVKYQSASTERITEFSPAEIIGDSGFDHVHPDDLEKIEEEFVPFVSQTNTEIQEELRVETKDGDWRWIEVRGMNKLDDPVIDGLLFSSRDITERKKREREIQQLNERLELAVEGAELGVWDWDMTTDEVEFNEQWAAMLGYSLDELESHLNAWKKRVHPDDLAEVEAALEAHIANETNYYDTEHRMRTADGDWKWIRDIGKIFDRDEDGEPIRAVGIHIDIDERKTYEQTLEQERDIFSQGPSTVFRWEDEEGWPVDYVSENVENVLGYSGEEFTSGNISYAEIVHEDDLDRVARKVAEKSDEGIERIKHEPYRLVTADGDVRWVLDRTKNVWENGDITHRLGYIIDITERKEHEEELEQVKRRLDMALQEARAGIWEWDIENEELYWSDELLDLLGVSADEFDGTFEMFEERLHPDDADRVMSAMEDAIETGSDYQVEHRMEKADGEYVWLDVRGQVVEDKDSQSLIGIGIDITERKEQETKLQQQRDQLDDFASVVSHDLRNPLNVAQGRIELAREACDTEHLDVAVEGIERSLDLIDDMLELARAGEKVSDMEAVDLPNMVHTCWKNVQTADATIVADLDATLKADRSRLRQLLENLFRNAIDHGGEDVNVNLGELDDGFYVEDDGPGIPESDREDVLEAGYSTSENGTGFGLRIVKEIVKAHNWNIRITEGKEGGARFEITGVEVVAE